MQLMELQKFDGFPKYNSLTVFICLSVLWYNFGITISSYTFSNTVGSVLKVYPIHHKNVVSQGRCSLVVHFN